MLTRLVRQVFPVAPGGAGRIAAAIFSLALVFMPAVPAPAQAADTVVGGCLWSWGAYMCTERWSNGASNGRERPAADPRDAAESAERERKWAARCKPEIRQDRFGVSRYRYAAPGCEFGKSED
jgi:hypothetical protein